MRLLALPCWAVRSASRARLCRALQGPRRVRSAAGKPYCCVRRRQRPAVSLSRAWRPHRGMGGDLGELRPRADHNSPRSGARQQKPWDERRIPVRNTVHSGSRSHKVDPDSRCGHPSRVLGGLSTFRTWSCRARHTRACRRRKPHTDRCRQASLIANGLITQIRDRAAERPTRTHQDWGQLAGQIRVAKCRVSRTPFRRAYGLLEESLIAEMAWCGWRHRGSRHP